MDGVVVGEDAVRRAFEVVELTRMHGPPEPGSDQEHEHDRERDQEEEDFHAGIYCGRP